MHTGDVRPVQVLFDAHQAPALIPNGATPARSRSFTSSASSSASPSSGSTPASSAKAGPTRRSSCIRNWPTWHASASPPGSPAPSWRTPDQGVLDPYNPTGSTAHVNFNTSKTDRWETDARPLPHQLGDPRQRLGGRVLPRGRVAPAVRAYVKNHNLGFEVPYRYGSETRSTGPTSSSWSTMATATTTSCTWSSRSRATGGRTPRKRRRRWKPTGCLA